MSINSVLYIVGTTMLMVFLRSAQQLNVQHDKKRWVPPVSYGMALCEVALVTSYAHHGLHAWVVLSAGSGAAVGCIVAMTIHKRLRHD